MERRLVDNAVGVGVAGERARCHRAVRRRGHGLLAGDERLDRIVVRDKFLDSGAHRGGVGGDVHRGRAGGQRRNRQALDAGARTGNGVGLADELLAAAIQRIKEILAIDQCPAGQPGGGEQIARPASCIAMPMSPVVLLASTNRLLTESYEAVTPAPDSLMLFSTSCRLSVVAL